MEERGKARFVALRIRPAGREIRKAACGPEMPACWLLAEWPATAPEPVQFWLSNLRDGTALTTLVRLAKLRWRTEHDYREMKQALGLAHFEVPHLERVAPPRHPRLRRPRLLHTPRDWPQPHKKRRRPEPVPGRPRWLVKSWPTISASIFG
ncbi:hypothetical protein GCM10023083_50620 [Streptomyces phyllanthi]